mgnify:FL=1
MTQKIVVLTDVHLGQRGHERGGFGQESLLADPRPGAHRRIEWLRNRVAAFAENDPVHLVVTGDLLDLSLATMRDGLEDLGLLLAALPAVREMTWVVGNHDHHVWMLHSESRRVLAPLADGELPGDVVYARTPRAGELCTLFAPYLARAAGRDVPLRLAYPSFELDLPDGDSTRRAWFIHGDLFGGFYSLLSRLLAPRMAGGDVDHERAAATVNAAVIEFVYWLLGAIGEGFGVDGLLEELYTDLQRGDHSLLRQLIEREAELLVGERGGALSSVERAIAERVMLAGVKHFLGAEPGPLHERTASMSASKDRHQQLSRTRENLAAWVHAVGDSGRPTLLFHGHTHMADRWHVPGTAIETFNLGSWLHEPNRGAPQSWIAEIAAVPGRPLSVRCVYGGEGEPGAAEVTRMSRPIR